MTDLIPTRLYILIFNALIARSVTITRSRSNIFALNIQLEVSIMAGKNILLIEPNYRNKYPPLGLMKLAAYHGPYGRGDYVMFVKGDSPEVWQKAWDRIYVTTLFSFEWNRTADAIDFAIRAAGGQSERVFVGGIAATLMHDQFVNEPKWAGVRFIKGLLDGVPAKSLQLSAEESEFGADDTVGTPIEELVPDYSILDHVAYRYPVNDAYFGYASRGCVRKCSFCGVPQLEGPQRNMPPLSAWIHGVKNRYGEKKDLVLMDNNVVAAPKYREIIAEIADLGFKSGATIRRGDKHQVKRRVDFNQGVDARILSKSPMYLREMSRICISPLRIAFDHIGVRRPYETAVRMAAQNQILSLSNYMLYNFMDTPQDLYQRMRLNIDLNQELDVRIWSFPMRYQPVNLKDRSHVGKNWNRYQLRSFQLILQATHGVVSANPKFFIRAYGNDHDDFLHLLSLPHAFIFHRDYYEFGEGQAVREEYEALKKRMTTRQVRDLHAILDGRPAARRPGEKRLLELAEDRSLETSVREAIRFHAMSVISGLPQGRPDRPLPVEASTNHTTLADDEIVEDAGLFDHEQAPARTRREIELMMR